MVTSRQPVIVCGSATITPVSEYDWRFDVFDEHGVHWESSNFISLYAAVDRMRIALKWKQNLKGV